MMIVIILIVYGPCQKKNICFMHQANNKGTDQPEHLCSITSTLVTSIHMHSLKSTVATFKFSFF